MINFKTVIQLEPLKSEHLEQVVKLDQTCLGGLWTLSGYQREIDSPHSNALVLSLLPQQQIIGLGCFWSILEEAHITLLAIEPDYQGQGLGKLLLYNLLFQAREQKLERATLEVKISNQIALALYQKFGFKIAGIRKQYYQKTQEDALILWQSGLNSPEFLENLKTRQKELENSLKKHQWSWLNPVKTI
ncbi:ribosomal protein S18-alanine N-acetyltransferase [Gloeocapsa sp. PCC 73106]|uniref:ribosomal protein S18-alanine N-acetyltransferase n=1 Tax=Gloeocapsa sp. PCC 73106 TaxID=102232 RepID=UPI0002ABA115|nr:ribosomal protein S18-alanine N-acetyltransferase [Gloeocapsa sp. PCC 73106]ELR96624.1 ribosomal-protein-alanine acetyltransferase [Gloeocapsa sp. PCC 73106]